ncbi:hypothetical protein SKAU_G00215980 [Synaphobranchus kaupii]|uniref:Uncharacterized protein n=1 Tax=Synaphobranchus kaupii TaxID=118154 RepID=A0A9Q1IVE5_SYNKA|nr:hypothetical protein SKAU_G00215980 [Synaphobranchus kaupii]
MRVWWVLGDDDDDSNDGNYADGGAGVISETGAAGRRERALASCAEHSGGKCIRPAKPPKTQGQMLGPACWGAFRHHNHNHNHNHLSETRAFSGLSGPGFPPVTPEWLPRSLALRTGLSWRSTAVQRGFQPSPKQGPPNRGLQRSPLGSAAKLGQSSAADAALFVKTHVALPGVELPANFPRV